MHSMADFLADAIESLARAPKGGVFASIYVPGRNEVRWRYDWLTPSGCRNTILGIIAEPPDPPPPSHRSGPDERVDRYVGLDECYAEWEDRANMAWVTHSYSF